MSLMVSISGIRGIVGESLTPETIVKYAAAFAEYCGRGPIVIGRDGRVTGKSIGHIVSSTLLQMGCDVIALGVCPTPTVALAVVSKRAAGGISITASHNPMQWNGLKFFAPTGLFLDAEENRALWALADASHRSYAAWNRQGKHIADPGFIDEHIANVLSLRYVDVATVKRRRFKVVVDCVNASAAIVVPKLLRTLGCDVVEMYCDSSGIFPHTPEPLPENLTELSSRVRTERADMGIAVDPDGDRLVLIDETGESIGEEYTLACVVDFVLGHRLRDLPNAEVPPVVINLSTSRAIEDVAAKYGVNVLRTAVGEINVAKKMREIGAVIGGEGNGGVILSDSHIGRDALVGIGLILQQLTEFGGTLSQLKKSMPQYSIVKGKVDLGSLHPDGILKSLAERFGTKAKATTIDGLKLDFPSSWVHLRKSNTEPIIRIIAEAPEMVEAEALVKQFTGEILKG
jgi:phosphomannomutase